MIERERLIELLQNWENKENDSVRAESIADYLLEHGVIVPACKVGDIIYRVDNETVYDWWRVVSIRIYADETVYFDDSENIFKDEDFGKTVFLSKEQAEKALEGGAINK